MEPYTFKRNREGIHIINISKSWEKLMVSARIIASIKNPKDVLVSVCALDIFSFFKVVSGREYA